MKILLQTEAYDVSVYPPEGRHILAQTTDDLIVVYQAYKERTATYTVRNQKLGGPEYSFNRMSWIKPNFLWMMYRSGWASKEGQERVLAFWIGKAFFDRMLSQAVPSSFSAEHYQHIDAWKKDLDQSEVRLQWDPDHDPSGKPLQRRAIQLGLKGAALKEFATSAIRQVEDITPFVAMQSEKITSTAYNELIVPIERVYTPDSLTIRNKVGLDSAI